MPHSSGGGSHGGGYHGGGRSGSSTPTYSRSYFPGATRYIYYDLNHNPQTIYSKRNPAAWKPVSKKFYLITIAVWAVICGAMLINFHTTPKKLAMDYDTEIRISDGAGVLSEEDEKLILTAFKAFREASGITPAMATVTRETWKGNYSSLENYAYDLYVNLFPDEKHWLIVYSEPAARGDGFVAWEWHGMQGDDTDGIITEKVAENFGKNLQKRLTASSRYTLGQAVQESFDAITPDLMSRRVNTLSLGIILTASITVFTIILSVYVADVQGKKYANAVKAPDVVTEANCEFCGGLYVIGTVPSCPHCGAAIPARAAE